MAFRNGVGAAPKKPLGGFFKAKRLKLALMAMATLVASGAAFAAAEKEKETVLYTFTGGSDGGVPSSGLTYDAKGALYGTTSNGGAANYGVAFKVAPPSSGAGPWTETPLYAFTGGSDGGYPGGGLIFDAQGALYGTAQQGGSGNLGVVLKLTPPASGAGPWTETVLYSFTGGSGGWSPSGGLIFDAQGALYGTAIFGGTTGGACYNAGCGVVFKLTPPASGAGPWTETVLHAFTGSDGSQPYSTLIFDAEGALYGTTSLGGTCAAEKGGCGVVFKLTPPSSGAGPWTETVLYSFTGGSDGLWPASRLIFDAEGALYGAASAGGVVSGPPNLLGNGVVFKLTPPTSGAGPWTESVLYAFPGGSDGAGPMQGVIFDAKGALYGATAGGGVTATCNGGCGVAFKLTPPSSGAGPWTETVLESFRGADGYYPRTGLIMDAKGALFGTTTSGGSSLGVCKHLHGCGVVFELN
jgi:uncharacterized repeat protein (TIGR03803 family)